MTDELVAIHAGDAELVVAPIIGGSIARYSSAIGGKRLDWLRRASDADIAAGDPRRLGSFPLVPFSNRIREGKFAVDGRRVALPLNSPPMPHAIHGMGWQAPWKVAGRRDAELVIEHRNDGGAWPFPYVARQTFHLRPDAMTVALEVENTGHEPMPLGLGWHPYFPRTKQAVVTAAVARMWSVDHEVMPVGLTEPPPDHDPRKGLAVDRFAIDNGFTGWDGRAVIGWPERAARLVIAAAPPLRFLVIFTPANRDFFCVEPVSHATDAFNLAAQGRGDTGMLMLAPRDRQRAAMTLTPQVA